MQEDQKLMWNKITVFTDGSCYSKTRKGGFGVYIVDDTKKEYFYKKGYKNTTISRMELRAVIFAIQKISKTIPIELNVYSDSEYVVKAFTENRIMKWNMYGWADVKNLDLWYLLIEEIQLRPMMKLKFNHVKGHGKDLSNFYTYGNNIADCLADLNSHKNYNEDQQMKTKPVKLKIAEFRNFN